MNRSGLIWGCFLFKDLKENGATMGMGGYMFTYAHISCSHETMEWLWKIMWSGNSMYYMKLHIFNNRSNQYKFNGKLITCRLWNHSSQYTTTLPRIPWYMSSQECLKFNKKYICSRILCQLSLLLGIGRFQLQCLQGIMWWI